MAKQAGPFYAYPTDGIARVAHKILTTELADCGARVTAPAYRLSTIPPSDRDHWCVGCYEANHRLGLLRANH